MDALAGRISETIVIQKGTSEIETCHATSFSWAYGEDFERYFETARVVVCHAGVGTILDARRRGKPVLVVPRLKRFGEVFDDHQLEICEALSSSHGVVCVFDVKGLGEALAAETPLRSNASSPNKTRLINALREIVNLVDTEDSE